MDLKELRQRIDEIDEKLLPLFLERMEVSKKVAEYKKENGIPILNKTREREILCEVSEKSGDKGLYSHRLYQTILELSRAYQSTFIGKKTTVGEDIEKMKKNVVSVFPESGVVAVQGVEGAYSSMAAERMFPRGNQVFFKSFEGVFNAVESGLCKFGVLPIENSSNGSVRATYDLLQKKNVKIVRSMRLCIRHELLGIDGAKLSQIKTIYSHNQALGQCSQFIKSLGDGVKIVEVENTAMAAELVAKSGDKTVAAIASHNNCEIYGLSPIACDIMDSDNNYTRFVCISKDAELYAGSDHIGLILALEHKPGALYDILSKLAAFEINLIKLESCPIVGHDFEFMFFFEMKASVLNENVTAMLESIEEGCESFVFLGNYLEA